MPLSSTRSLDLYVTFFIMLGYCSCYCTYALNLKPKCQNNEYRSIRKRYMCSSGSMVPRNPRVKFWATVPTWIICAPEMVPFAIICRNICRRLERSRIQMLIGALRAFMHAHSVNVTHNMWLFYFFHCHNVSLNTW